MKESYEFMEKCFIARPLHTHLQRAAAASLKRISRILGGRHGSSHLSLKSVGCLDPSLKSLESLVRQTEHARSSAADTRSIVEGGHHHLVSHGPAAHLRRTAAASLKGWTHRGVI